VDNRELLLAQLEDAHGVLNGTIADLTADQTHWAPPGIALPIGATLAHIVVGEDRQVNGILRGNQPLHDRDFQGATGLSELPPAAGQDYRDWAARLTVDLDAMGSYAAAVQQETVAYVSSLTPLELDGDIDLTAFHIGVRSSCWVFGCIVVTHINNHVGEISCLKGIQGAKGYPF
jgi:hypothetical protein